MSQNISSDLNTRVRMPDVVTRLTHALGTGVCVAFCFGLVVACLLAGLGAQAFGQAVESAEGEAKATEVEEPADGDPVASDSAGTRTDDGPKFPLSGLTDWPDGMDPVIRDRWVTGIKWMSGDVESDETFGLWLEQTCHVRGLDYWRVKEMYGRLMRDDLGHFGMCHVNAVPAMATIHSYWTNDGFPSYRRFWRVDPPGRQTLRLQKAGLWPLVAWKGEQPQPLAEGSWGDRALAWCVVEALQAEENVRQRNPVRRGIDMLLKAHGPDDAALLVIGFGCPGSDTVKHHPAFWLRGQGLIDPMQWQAVAVAKTQAGELDAFYDNGGVYWVLTAGSWDALGGRLHPEHPLLTQFAKVGVPVLVLVKLPEDDKAAAMADAGAADVDAGVVEVERKNEAVGKVTPRWMDAVLWLPEK